MLSFWQEMEYEKSSQDICEMRLKNKYFFFRRCNGHDMEREKRLAKLLTYIYFFFSRRCLCCCCYGKGINRSVWGSNNSKSNQNSMWKRCEIRGTFFVWIYSVFVCPEIAPSERERERTKEIVRDHIYMKWDWICESSSGDNDDENDGCSSSVNNRTASVRSYCIVTTSLKMYHILCFRPFSLSLSLGFVAVDSWYRAKWVCAHVVYAFNRHTMHTIWLGRKNKTLWTTISHIP